VTRSSERPAEGVQTVVELRRVVPECRVPGPPDPLDLSVTDHRLVLLGGAAMDGPRHIWWNFVSSRKERIEQAKADWKLARFDTVPGDDKEFIPLPD